MSSSMKVAWSDALCTGNRAIDNQHKYLIDIVNDLADAIESGKTASSMKKIVNLLQYYTEWHFCKEEDCMNRLKCPVAARNKDAHAQFIETFLAFRSELEAGGDSAEIATRMYKTLTAWLVQHIQGIDSNLRHVSGEEVPATAPTAATAPEPEPEPSIAPVAEPPVPEPSVEAPPSPVVEEKGPAKKWWQIGS
jgi:hemerythrin